MSSLQFIFHLFDSHIIHQMIEFTRTFVRYRHLSWIHCVSNPFIIRVLDRSTLNEISSWNSLTLSFDAPVFVVLEDAMRFQVTQHFFAIYPFFDGITSSRLIGLFVQYSVKILKDVTLISIDAVRLFSE